MEDGRPRLSSSTPPASSPSLILARILSIAGHPFVLIPLTVAFATRNWVWTAIVAAGTILPLLAIILRNVRRGVWSDHDVSRHEQRGGLYRVALPLVVLSTVLLYFLDAGPQMLRSFAAAAVMLLLGVLGNRFLKISMHMMTAAFCGVMIAWLYPLATFAIVPFVAAIAWSRRKLERHTWAEVAVGLAIGAGTALVAVL
jgi:membrane-associated phospholipid phosphatase